MKAFQILICVSFFLIGGCSSESDKATPVGSKKESILEYQVKSSEKAKEVEPLLQNSTDNFRENINTQTSAKLDKSPNKTVKKQPGSRLTKDSVEVISWDMASGKNWAEPTKDQENRSEDSVVIIPWE